ncbi:MAG: adenylyl-sulfate kinase [Cyanobacteria bacterium J06639_1]
MSSTLTEAIVTTETSTLTHKGCVIWFTGLSGAGKSTVSEAVSKALKKTNCKLEVLDGDVVRTNLSKGLGFSREDRNINILRIGFVCELLARNGVIAMTAAISPYRAIRDQLKARIPNFIEIFVDASVEECARRDVKGLYAKAFSGEIKQFTGVSDPYEEPLNPDLVLNTTDETVEESAMKVLNFLVEKGYIEGWSPEL